MVFLCLLTILLDIYSLTQVGDDDANYVAIDSAFFVMTAVLPKIIFNFCFFDGTCLLIVVYTDIYLKDSSCS